MTYGSDSPHTQAQHGRVPPPMPPRKPRRQRSREEILREQVKCTERELARLRDPGYTSIDASTGR
jgi:hypothetical protein